MHGRWRKSTHTRTHTGAKKVRSQELQGTLGILKQNGLFLVVSVLCLQSRPSVKRWRLNLSVRRRTHLTRGACEKCEFLFEAGNCSWHTRFLTSFLLFFTASASSQSTTFLNSLYLLAGASPANKPMKGGEGSTFLMCTVRQLRHENPEDSSTHSAKCGKGDRAFLSLNLS